MRSVFAAQWAPLFICVYGSIYGGVPALAEPCTQVVSRADVVGCALAASLEVRQARLAQKSIAARRIAAGLWLPSNPVVTGSVEGSTIRPPGAIGSATPAVEWQVTLAQEIETGGQRWARLAANDAEASAQSRRLGVVEVEVAATALKDYAELVLAKARLVLADELLQSMATLARFAKEREGESLIAPVDAHLLGAEGVRIGLVRIEARRRVEVARAALSLSLGHELAFVDTVGDDLPAPSMPAPLSVLVARALEVRGELAAAAAEHTFAAHQLALSRRSRAPNITLSAFTGLDVLGEQILGGSLSLPLPLPAPLGHTFAAEIADGSARRRQSEVTLAQTRRQVQLEVAEALALERARADALELYPAPLIEQARADVRALRDGVATRQLSLRESLVAERTLIELLLGQIEARLDYAIAWIDLQRAVGELASEVRR